MYIVIGAKTLLVTKIDLNVLIVQIMIFVKPVNQIKLLIFTVNTYLQRLQILNYGPLRDSNNTNPSEVILFSAYFVPYLK